MATSERESTPLKRSVTGKSMDQTSPARTSRSVSINESKLNLQFWGQSFIDDNKARGVNTIEMDNEKIYEIYSGETHLFVNTKSKNIYGYGQNKFKQIEQGNKKECDASIPLEITRKIEVEKIYCGCDYTFMIGNKNRLFSWGFNGKGQLGLGHNENVNEPTQVKYFHFNKNELNATEFNDNEFVIDVQCSSLHTIIQTNRNRLLSTGFGETYALGHGNNTSLNTFKEISYFSDLCAEKKLTIGKVELGVTHSACIISKKLFLWGMYGKSKNQIAKKPFIVGVNQDILEFFLGDMLTVILGESGEVMTLGDNIDDQLTVDSTSLVKIQLPHKIEYIAGGLNHVFAVNFSKGKIYAWGSNRYGQINPTNSQQSFKSPTEMTWLYQNGSFALTCKGNSTFFVSKNLLKINKESTPDSNREKEKQSLTPNQIASTPEFKKITMELDSKIKQCDQLSKNNGDLKDEIARLTAMLANTNKDKTNSTAESSDPNNQINDCILTRDIPIQVPTQKREDLAAVFRN